MEIKFKKIINFIPALIWMLVIFYFSSRQTTGIGGSSFWLRFFILKSFHIIEYAILTLLLFLAIKKYKCLIIISYLYALSDEIHQYFVSGRSACFRDTLFDLTGILIAIFLIKIFQKKPILK